MVSKAGRRDIAVKFQTVPPKAGWLAPKRCTFHFRALHTYHLHVNCPTHTCNYVHIYMYTVHHTWFALLRQLGAGIQSGNSCYSCWAVSEMHISQDVAQAPLCDIFRPYSVGWNQTDMYMVLCTEKGLLHGN